MSRNSIPSRSTGLLTMATALVAIWTSAPPLVAQLDCDGAPEGFAQAVPPGWSVVDGAGGGLLWADLAGCGEGSNFTGGSGGAACASSDRFGLGAFDTALVSPPIDLSTAADPVLRFAVNYQGFAAADRLDVELSSDQGLTWTSVLSLREDYGVFRQAVGETLEIDLSAFAGQSNLTLRFRYHDAEADAFDWYAQIDDVSLSCNVPVCASPPVTGAVSDGGFEGGTPNAAWTETSAAFSTPICTNASCGFAGARTSDAWAFLGGSASGGTDSLEQDVNLPFGIGSLRFFLWIPAASGAGNDELRVTLDGQLVFTAGEDAARFRPGYRRVDLDVSDFADGGVHLLRFESTSSAASGHTSFFVDDVTAEVCTAVVANPEISIDDVAFDEGNAGRRDAVFTVSLSDASRDVVTVDFATADVTARVADDDYEAVSGTLSFPRGALTRTVAVPVNGDVTDEPSETFTVNLSNPAKGVIADGQGFATLVNDDFSFVSISSTAALEREGVTTQAVFAVSLSTPSSQEVTVGFETVDGTAQAGLDYEAASGTLVFPPGSTSRTVAVDVFDDVRVERDETFFVDLSGALNAVIDEPRGNGKIVDNDRGRFPVEGTDVLYTETVDFEQGRFLNTNTGVPDQVQLDRVRRTFPNIWVAASARGTIVRVDTRTGTVLGEYSTNPDVGSSPNPSRTTVALDGTVWAGNRGDASVIHVGLVEENQCVDRNGNGAIETSSGYGDVLPWPNASGADSDGGVETATDECILHYVKVSSSVTRHLSVDRDNNVWVSGVGGRNARVFDLVDSDSGQLLRTEGPFPCGGYGGLVDKNGVLWSAQYNGPVLRWDTATANDFQCVSGVASYGLAIDPGGDVWVAGPSGDRVWEISSDGSAVRGPFEHGSPSAQGLAADAGGDVWVSSAKWGGSATVGHVRPDGTFLGNVTGVPRGSSGVAVDVDGNVWTANAAASSLSRINPALGPVGADGVTRIGQVDLEVALPGANPYNYSDMTGSLALANTSPQGTWQVIQDSGLEGAQWGVITWNTEPEGDEPTGSSLTVEARAADSEAGLGGESFVEVANGIAFDLTGRFLQVRATLKPGEDDAGGEGAGPILSDMRVSLADPTQGQPFGLSVDNQTVFESDSGFLEVLFNVSVSAPSDGSVEVFFDVFEGSATENVDYTPMSGRVVLTPGSESAAIAVTVFGDTDPEADETFFVKLRDPIGAVLTDAVGVGTIVDDDLRLGPVAGDCVHYTLDADFDLGRLFNTNHKAPGSDQLQLDDDIKPFPFIWIAASGRGTIVKIDTRTGAILGEYSTNPDNRGGPDPSRTTVSVDGSVWVGNRQDGGSVTHIGQPDLNQCVDRNGNGVIETSTGYGDLLPWPNPGNVDTAGGVTTALDECILHYVRVAATRTRHVTLDGDGNVWVSGHEGANPRVFQLIDGETGEILRTEGPFPCGGYGGFVDRDNVLWSSTQFSTVLRWDVDAGEVRCLSGAGLRAYGLGIAPDGWVWASDARAARAWKISPDGNTILGPFTTAGSAQGLAVTEDGDVWISTQWTANRPFITHLDDDGTFLGRVEGVPAGSSGVAVDLNGKVWTANYRSRTAARIDPTKGPIGADGVTPLGEVDLVVDMPGSAPYNYSDMTGFVALQATAPRGTWRAIQDGGEDGTPWGRVTWNTEPQGLVPAGASISVDARAADTVAGLGGLPFTRVDNGVPFHLTGRFIEVRATLRPNLDGESPVLSDVEICTTDLDLPAISIDDVTVTEGDPGGVAVLATFTVRLSHTGDEEVLVNFKTVDGNAAAGADYVERVGKLVFPPGVTSQPVEIDTLPDFLDEPDETFTIDLSFPVGAVIADGQGVGTILDDDPSVALSITGVTVEEGDEGTVDAVFDVTLDGPSNRTVRVDYVTANLTAEIGVDYQEGFGYLEIPPGTTAATITVQVLGDLEPEDDETYLVVLSNPDGALLIESSATGTIIDDDLRELSIDDVEIEEGDSGTVEAVFTVSLARPSSRDVTVDYATEAGTATEDADYLPASGTLTVSAGETSATISVLVEGDVFLEDDETFTVRLSNPVEAVLVDDEGLGTILDDELCPGPNLLANPSNELRPVDGELPFWTPLADTTWERRLAPPDPVDGEATFAPGVQQLAELSQDVDVASYASIVDGDEGQVFQFEGFVRTFEEAPSDVAQVVVEFLDATGQLVLDGFDTGQVSSPGEWRRVEDVRTAPAGTRSIRVRLLATRFTEGDNDAYFDALVLRSLSTATLAVDDVELYEGDSGTTDAVFTVTLSCPIEGTVTVDYVTSDGSAVQVEDYLATAGQLVIPSGTTALPVSVPVVGDEVHESHEVFHLDLAVASADFPVVAVDPRGDGLILNDDFCPRSPGFWKTHTDVWPVDYLELGGVEYDTTQLEAFLDYGGPDATLHLARQLVATKLNLAVGSDPFILPTVEEADLLLIDFPPGSDPKGQDKQRVNAVKDELDAYNSPDFCEETPVIPESAINLVVAKSGEAAGAAGPTSAEEKMASTGDPERPEEEE